MALLFDILPMLPQGASQLLLQVCCLCRSRPACCQAQRQVFQQVMRKPHGRMLLPLNVQHLHNRRCKTTGLLSRTVPLYTSQHRVMSACSKGTAETSQKLDLCLPGCQVLQRKACRLLVPAMLHQHTHEACWVIGRAGHALAGILHLHATWAIT